MFLLSKLAWLVIQPLSLSFLLIVASLLAGMARWKRLRSLLAVFASLVLFVTLFTTAGAVLLQTLEDRIARPAAPADVACIVVLGGGFETDVTTRRGGFELNQAGDRFVETLRLARLYPQAKILVSGGDGSISGKYEGDAIVAERFFPAFGIAADRLIQETTSRTTFENVQNLKGFLDERGLKDCLLVTSAFHMPRAMGLTRKADLAMTPWPTDYRTRGDEVFGFDFTQPSLNAQLMTTATREWTGLLAYYLTGRTNTLFPR